MTEQIETDVWDQEPPRTELERLSKQVVQLQDLLTQAEREAARALGERDAMRERVSEPNGCAHCGHPKRSHARRYLIGVGMHEWERPTDEQVKTRMLARRAARKPLETETPPHGKLWSLLDWSFWGAGMGDVFRMPLADQMIAAIPPETIEQAEQIMAEFIERRQIEKTGVTVYQEQRDELEQLRVELDRVRANRDYWRGRYRAESRTTWSSEVPPGGEVCADCGEPVESEPCAEHNPTAIAEQLRARVAELEAQADRLDHLDRITLPELRREIQHHQDGKKRWRDRAEKAEARVAELEAERPALCGRTRDISGTEYGPCTRRAGHWEAYCRSADSRAYFLAVNADQPATKGEQR